MNDNITNSLSIETVSHPHSHTSQHELPDTLSGLLATAIADAHSLDPSKYHPRSEEWHSADFYEHCAVCLSGCVIAGTIAASPDETLFPRMFDEPTRSKLEALDYIRTGAWDMAFKSFYGRFAEGATEKMLHSLPQPFCPNFTGWWSFRAHLDSLSVILPQLREIEHDMAAS